MTREEYDFIGSMNMCDEISNEAYEKIMVHCDILEQEPCKDAISRKAVLEIVRDMHDLARADVLSHTINQIEKLSPINQEPKIGHWLPYVEENGETVNGYVLLVDVLNQSLKIKLNIVLCVVQRWRSNECSNITLLLQIIA